jgi:hypothetical protein
MMIRIKKMTKTTENQSKKNLKLTKTVKTAPRTAGNVSITTSAKAANPQILELNLRRIDPISAAKLGFFVSVALGVMFVVVIVLFWILLDTSGVIYQFMNAMINAGVGIKSGTGGIGISKIALIAGLLACINVILSTALAVLFSLIYNISASLSGGVKITFGRN